MGPMKSSPFMAMPLLRGIGMGMELLIVTVMVMVMVMGKVSPGFPILSKYGEMR